LTHHLSNSILTDKLRPLTGASLSINFSLTWAPYPLLFIGTGKMQQHLTSFRIFISGRIASVSSLFAV
jgi:hypothetical protein